MIVLPILGSNRSFELGAGKIVAVGLNYRDHIAELPGILKPAALPDPAKEPILFAKTPNVLIAHGDSIVIPASFIARYGFGEPRTDYEAELAVVIGRHCRNVSVADALSYVLGYTCFNDVSQRDIQNRDRAGWFRGKSFDTYGPIGPAIAPASMIGDPGRLKIECRLNGKTVQSSNTAAMIFGVGELIAFISANMSLEPGDIIVTGTPSGVGKLSAGDVVEVEIEGIGVLRNPVTES